MNGQQARQPAYTANRNGGERIVFQDNLRQQIIGYGQSEGIKNGNNPISGRPQEQGESFFPDQKPVTKFAWNLFTVKYIFKNKHIYALLLCDKNWRQYWISKLHAYSFRL